MSYRPNQRRTPRGLPYLERVNKGLEAPPKRPTPLHVRELHALAVALTAQAQAVARQAEALTTELAVLYVEGFPIEN